MGAFLKCNGRPLACSALCAALACLGLSNHAFWDDEANTAIFARNLLATGELSAWDGQNLIGYRNGAELDENLRNTYMPPLQYFVTALSFALLGEGTFQGRLPFVLAGALTVMLLALLMRSLTGGKGVEDWLAPLLLSASPAFLLFIRNCRYYSLSALLLLCLLLVVAKAKEARRAHFHAFMAAALTALLWLNHYFSAAYGVAIVSMLLLLPRFRNRRTVSMLATIALSSLAMGAWIFATRNPLLANVAEPGSHPWPVRLATLAWWHLRDLGPFEFIPLVLVLVLPLPFFVSRLAHDRETARIGLVLAGMIALSSLITAALSPQPLEQSNVADMRQQVAIIPLGAAMSAIALRILYGLRRPLALAAAALLLLTNILHLGFAGQRSGMLPARGIECTLGEYLYEVTHDYQTSTEALIGWIDALPPQTVVLVYPPYMAYSPMFYARDKRFCCQLDKTKDLSQQAKKSLPGYVYWESAQLQWAFISAYPPPVAEGPLDIRYRGHTYDLGFYRLIDYRDLFWEDRSRPEIPWHTFDPKEFENVPYRGFFVATVHKEL
ncbi:MAG: glycosyltransferase family 39 protein [Myxococcota bacterium]|jgi:hypothetical protein|nr:glycosyltransferase family 39 protein [Myxococcota bacterium]